MYWCHFSVQVKYRIPTFLYSSLIYNIIFLKIFSTTDLEPNQTITFASTIKYFRKLEESLCLPTFCLPCCLPSSCSKIPSCIVSFFTELHLASLLKCLLAKNLNFFHLRMSWFSSSFWRIFSLSIGFRVYNSFLSVHEKYYATSHGFWWKIYHYNCFSYL